MAGTKEVLVLLLTLILAQEVPLVISAPGAINLDPVFVSLIGGTLIPILTALLTKLNASKGLKALVALVLACALAGGSMIVQTEGVFTWQTLVLSVAAAFSANVVSYVGAWKPIGDTNEVPGAILTRNIGFGGSKQP